MCGRYDVIFSKTKWRLCSKHWFRKRARENLGNSELGGAIWGILNKQKYKCAYTGIDLEPGVNASLDHIIPKTKGGSNDLTNIQWIDKDVNIFKGGMMHAKFIEVIKKIREA